MPRPDLCCGQVGVEISKHQQRGPTGLLSDGHNDVFYCQAIVWGQVEPRNKPPLPTQRQLKSDNISDVYPELHRSVEHVDAAAVHARRL